MPSQYLGSAEIFSPPNHEFKFELGKFKTLLDNLRLGTFLPATPGHPCDKQSLKAF